MSRGTCPAQTRSNGVRQGLYLVQEGRGLQVEVIHVQGARREVLEEPGVPLDALHGQALRWVGHQNTPDQVQADRADGHVRGNDVGRVDDAPRVFPLLCVEGVAPEQDGVQDDARAPDVSHLRTPS